MFVAGDDILESLFHLLLANNQDDMFLGQAFMAKAKEAVKEAKKMHGLVKSEGKHP